MFGLGKILKLFVGDKSKKDLKEISPIIDEINSFEDEVKALNNDELRTQTLDFKKKINSSISDINIEINKQKAKLDETKDFDEKESLFSNIDKLNEKAYEISEQTLNEILPKAFAVVKETARRFVENKEILVKANDFDIELSARKEYVKINKGVATWFNSWDAAGKRIIWDMIHYDVQLVGGVAMHRGKVAEMQTGEGKTLVATLPVYLNALTGRGVHLVTVNDYLAKRDSAWLSLIHI